ncbi:MAG: hypothetical protein LBO06_04570 [Bacteroidales bacterium]|jgi:hypothetical protein|nr:hypothetical protein [Bacteroidales bacterium]
MNKNKSANLPNPIQMAVWHTTYNIESLTLSMSYAVYGKFGVSNIYNSVNYSLKPLSSNKFLLSRDRKMKQRPVGAGSARPNNNHVGQANGQANPAPTMCRPTFDRNLKQRPVGAGSACPILNKIIII